MCSDGTPETGPPGGSRDSSVTDTGDDRFEFESYYELLGVSEAATTEEIERAYRELAKQHHPDASTEPERVAERQFRQLLAARDVLTSVERRRAYDELGHREYRQQSESLGEPVCRDDTETADRSSAEPEPRPDPDRPGQVQRSARGRAHRRGDPLVTDAETAFGGPATDTPEGGATAGDTGDTGGQGIYSLVSESGPLESRSLGYVAARWARSWRTRAAVGVGAVLVAAGGLTALPAALDALGVELSVPEVTAGRLYAVALAAVVAHAGYSCAASEARLPRGAFLADRDHGRFSTAAARRYRQRGTAGLAVALALAVASARNGVSPWAHVSGRLRGETAGPVPWFDAPDADWTGTLDLALSGAFALAALGGALALALGTSIALWRGRYERGLRVRPSLWEPVLVVAPVSVLFVLTTGPVGVVPVGGVWSLPETVATAAGVDGSTVTTATVATAGVVLSVVAGLLLRARASLAGASGRRRGGDDSE